jgi:hypothetical protein
MKRTRSKKSRDTVPLSRKKRTMQLVACTKSLVIYNSVAHLNQHYNKDEDGKLGHGSAVDGYMIMLSAVVKWCCCCCWESVD